jgi:hypothetical protein
MSMELGISPDDDEGGPTQKPPQQADDAERRPSANRFVRNRLATFILILLGLLVATAAYWSSAEEGLQTDERAFSQFRQELQAYVAMRQAIVAQMGPAAPESEKEEVAEFQTNLTTAVISGRKGKQRGNIFSRDAESAIRQILIREFDGPQGATLIHAIKQGNPEFEGNPLPTDPTKEARVPVKLAVNGLYPFAAPVSNVPPSLLQKLPALPSEVRYRFVGGSLILRDRVATVILDYIPDVIPKAAISR